MKAAGLVPGLNNMIGQDICLYVNVGGIFISSMSSTFKPSGTFVRTTFCLLTKCTHIFDINILIR